MDIIKIKSPMEINVKVKVMPAQPCIVRNYRSKYKTWENGKVSEVSVKIQPDGTYYVQYRVILNRRSTGKTKICPNGGDGICLTVGDDRIEPASNIIL